jgi:hypothetical protein
MAPPTKKQLNKGFYGFESDDAAFLRIDRDPWEASASGQGYNARWDDDTGYKRGQQSMGGDEASFLRASQSETYGDQPHDRLAGLIDSDEGMGSGHKLTGGGGPVSKGGNPRIAPKQTKPYRTNDGF